MNQVDIRFDTPHSGPIARTPLKRLLPERSATLRFVREDLRRLAIRLGELLEPYEHYAATVQWEDPSELIDYYLLLQQDSRFFDEVLKGIRRLGDRMYRAMVSTCQANKLAGVLEHVAKFQEAMNTEFLYPLWRDGRRLAYLAGVDAVHYSQVVNMTDHLKQTRIDDYIRQTQDLRAVQDGPDHSMHQAWWWWLVSKMTSGEAAASQSMSEVELDDAVRVLSEAYIRPSELMFVPVPSVFQGIPGLADVQCLMQVRNGPFATELATFYLSWGQGRGIEWRLSRGRGRFQARINFFVTGEEPFEHYGQQAAHDSLRRDCIQIMLDALADGRLQEEISSGGESVRERLEFLAFEREFASATQPDPPSGEMSDPPRANAPSLVESIDSYGSIGTGKRTRRQRVERNTGALTWRRIMGALGRCTVEIKTGTHPRLRFDGRFSGFLNRHSGESTVFNRRVVEQALETLGIPLDEFYAKL